MMTRILALALSTIVSIGVFLVLTRDTQFSFKPADQSEPLQIMTMGNNSSSQATINSVFFEDVAESIPMENKLLHNSTGQLVDVNEYQFNQLVTQGVVLVEFGAHWCGPCREMQPELEHLAADNSGSLTVLTVDIDQEKALAKRYEVNSIPHLLLFRNGQQVHQWNGFEKASQMQRQIDKTKASVVSGNVRSNPFAI